MDDEKKPENNNKGGDLKLYENYKQSHKKKIDI